MHAATKIAVAGATGRVGTHAVHVLRERGVEVVPIARSYGVDVVTGEGLDEALRGVTAVIDCATGPSPDEDEATAFFRTATANLHAAGARAGVERIVVVSIINAERFPGGYNAAKVAHELAALSGPVPAVILRAAQFHEFVEQLVDWGTLGSVAYVPAMQTRLVAARTVAEALADLALAADPPPQSEIAGPRVESLVAMADLLVATRGTPARVVGGHHPDPAEAELYETGGLLPGAGVTLAGPAYAEWLSSTRVTVAA